jgi:hypothetical protein
MKHLKKILTASVLATILGSAPSMASIHHLMGKSGFAPQRYDNTSYGGYNFVLDNESNDNYNLLVTVDPNSKSGVRIDLDISAPDHVIELAPGASRIFTIAPTEDLDIASHGFMQPGVKLQESSGTYQFEKQ